MFSQASVILSTGGRRLHPGGICIKGGLHLGGLHPGEGGSASGGSASRGLGSTHPTGMHSCFFQIHCLFMYTKYLHKIEFKKFNILQCIVVS